MPVHIGTLAAILGRSASGMLSGNPAAHAEQMGWKDGAKMLTRAALGEMNAQFSTVAGTGANLTGFTTSLRGQSLAAEVEARAQQWPLHSRVGVFAESGFAAAEINEEAPIAPVQLSNGIVTVSPSKVSAIIAYSLELFQTNGAAAAIEADLRKAIGRGLDKALISRIAPGSAGGFAGTSSALADIKELVSFLAVTGAEPLVMGAAIDVNIAAAALQQDGAEVFPEVNFVGMGAVKGIPWIPTDQLAAGSLLLVDSSGLAFTINSVEIVVGKAAALQLDTAPNMPANLVSLFQTSSIGVLATCTFACEVMRSTDVSAECTSIAWASS